MDEAVPEDDEVDDPVFREERERDQLLLQQACSQLRRNFDSVQIFAVRTNPGGDSTVSANWGSGDWYSRYGAAQLWVKGQRFQ